MKKFMILLPFIGLIQGCNYASASSSLGSIENEVLHESYYNEYGELTSKGSVIIKSQELYDNELSKRSSEPTKTINFDIETILLIDMGRRPSGGYSVELESLIEESDHVIANVILSLPGDSCGVTHALTNPYRFIKIKTSKEILVSETLEFKSC